MIKVTIGKETIQFPTKWEDVTFKQFVQIMETKTKTEHVCILMGKKYDDIKNVKFTGVEQLLTASQFLSKDAKFDLYYPQVGTYKLPSNNQHNKDFDIRFESLGQFEDLRQVMTGLKTDDPVGITKAYGKAVAIYLQKLRDKEYDPAKVPELEEELQSFKACEVIAVGQFFFLKLISLTSGTVKTSPPTAQSQKKSPPVSKGSRKPLGRTRR